MVVGRVLAHEVGRQVVVGVDREWELAQPEATAGCFHALRREPPAGFVHHCARRLTRPRHGLEQSDVADVVAPLLEVALVDGGDASGDDLAVLPRHQRADRASFGERTRSLQHRQLQGLHRLPPDRPLLVDAVVELHELGERLLAAQFLHLDGHVGVLHPGPCLQRRALHAQQTGTLTDVQVMANAARRSTGRRRR